MNKPILLIFMFFCVGCSNQSELVNNGTTKKITECFIKIEYDSINKPISDTLAITEEYYNKDDQKIKSHTKSLFDNESIDIEFVYDKFNKVEKEVVKISLDSSVFVVNYYYKDSILYQTIGESKNTEIHFIQKSNYKFHRNKKFKEISMSYIFIDLELNDTTGNSFEVYKYNEEGLLTETKIVNIIDPKENGIVKYDYENCKKSYALRYNQNDSLISTINYKYELDELSNWTIIKSIVNGKLESIKTRKIEYK